MVLIIALFAVIALIGLLVRSLRNRSAKTKGDKAIKLINEDPAKFQESLSKYVHKCWYINMDQIPQWNSAIVNMPETFRIGGFANVNHWKLINDNEVVLVVVAEYSVMAGGLSGRTSSVPKKFTFNAHLRANPATGNYEMRVPTPDNIEEKNSMATFGRKFFEALKERQ